ncbi:MAG TPA: hypothetical protein VGF48_23100 [Thermoanaerobaculia bacterium]
MSERSGGITLVHPHFEASDWPLPMNFPQNLNIRAERTADLEAMTLKEAWLNG